MMNNVKYTVSGLLSVILLPLSMQVSAQPAGFSECQAIEDRQARYDCYDGLDAASGVVRESVPAGSDSMPASPVQNQAQERVQERVQERAQEKDERSLLGRIFRRDSSDEPAAPARTTTKNAPPAPRANIERSQNAKAAVDGADDEFEFVDTIADLDQPAPHIWVITLQAGQTWQQTTSKRYNLEEGDEVRIYPTNWGSNYRLSSEKAGGFIQVRRIR